MAVFCACADNYVGVDDPQLLAMVFFMAGLYTYIRGGRRGWPLGLAALLFVVGGNLKHNLIEFPLAVLVDLAIEAPRRAVRFALAGALMAAVSVELTSRIDGAAYLSSLLAPRSFSAHFAMLKLLNNLGPLFLPLVAAMWMVRICFRNPAQRVLALLLVCASPVNAFFSGGRGCGQRRLRLDGRDRSAQRPLLGRAFASPPRSHS